MAKPDPIENPSVAALVNEVLIAIIQIIRTLEENRSGMILEDQVNLEKVKALMKSLKERIS